MSEFQRRQDAADIDAMIAESQRPAPTDGWRPFVSAPEGGLREAAPGEVLRRALGGEEVVVAFCCGVLCGAAGCALAAMVLG